MSHTRNKINFQRPKSSTLESRRQVKAEILEQAKLACERLGGFAMIDDRYVVVDTTMFTVTPVPIPEVRQIPRGRHGSIGDDVPYPDEDTRIIND